MSIEDKTQLEKEIEFLYGFGPMHMHMEFYIPPNKEQVYLIDHSRPGAVMYLIKELGKESYIYQIMKKRCKKTMKPKEILDVLKKKKKGWLNARYKKR